MSSSAAWRADRLGQVRDDHRLARRRPCSRARRPRPARASSIQTAGQPEGRLDRRDAGEARHRVAGVHRELVARRSTRQRATSSPRTLITYSCDSSETSSWIRTGAITMPELGRDLAPDDADAREQAAAAYACRPAARARSRSRARAGRRRARRTAASALERRLRAPRSRRAAAAASRSCVDAWRFDRAADAATSAPPTRKNGSFGRPGHEAHRHDHGAGDRRRARLCRASGR